jgi:nucleotide-binding universal stress UspA family protein
MTNQIPHGAVVCGVDGSPGSDAAMTKAAELARLERRPLHLLHAEPIPVSYLRAWPYQMVDNLPALVQQASRQTLTEAVERARTAFPDLEITSTLRQTDAREALTRASEQAWVVVVGSRGHGGFSHLPLGSVGMWVSQHSHCPTVVIRQDQPTDASAPIVVGTDGTEVSAAALEFAFSQASFQQRPLTVVHCYDEVFQGGYGLTGAPDEELEGLPEERLAIGESIAGLREKYVDVEATTRLLKGPATSTLVHASEQAAMVVVGSRQRTRAAALFLGATSRGVVEHARCSVAVVPTSS